jgi:hypothetical protein
MGAVQEKAFVQLLLGYELVYPVEGRCQEQRTERFYLYLVLFSSALLVSKTAKKIFGIFQKTS